MNKKVMIALAAAVVACVGFYAYNTRQAKAPARTERPAVTTASSAAVSAVQSEDSRQLATGSPQSASQPDSRRVGSSAASQAAPHYSSGEESGDLSAPADIQVLAVEYDGAAFSPATENITTGDWIFFRNKSEKNFLPAAVGSGYPEFAAPNAVAPGGEFKFQFTKAGDWKYTDRLNPSVGGVIHVRLR